VPTELVHLLVLNGDADVAKATVRADFPHATLVEINKRQLRELGIREQVKALHRLRGEAFIVFSQDRESLADHQALYWSGLFHRCRWTVFAFADGKLTKHSRGEYFGAAFKLLGSAMRDLLVVLRTYLLLRSPGRRSRDQVSPQLELAFLFPFLPDPVSVGGAMSHIGGFLTGLKRRGFPFKVFAGKVIAGNAPTIVVKPLGRAHLLREAKLLSFNFDFIRQVEPQLRSARPAAIYQRHGRFTVAGAVLAKRLNIPFILEFNGSEVWVSKHWDPTLLPGLLDRCEKFSLANADHIMVVSEVLKADLVRLGFSAELIHVNPNGVDPDRFFPGCGGKEVRRTLGFKDDEVLAGFVGSFSYWHGIEILKEAILQLAVSGNEKLRFLLIGDGPLRAEIRAQLAAYEDSGRVIFLGLVPHASIPAYLDACDILLSPHVPLRDGSPFFGSPTKLFEYMAMGKAIVASRLEQLAVVLRDEHSSLLVTPGDAQALSEAVLRLVHDPGLRRSLGEQARKDVIAEYTWERNASRVLELISAGRPVSVVNTHCPVPVTVPRND
jgi:glycosyltransferase involved in cell wall biosynthesis